MTHVQHHDFDHCDWQAHEDGPVYFPAASIVSLGSSAVMHFRRKSNNGELSCMTCFTSIASHAILQSQVTLHSNRKLQFCVSV